MESEAILQFWRVDVQQLSARKCQLTSYDYWHTGQHRAEMCDADEHVTISTQVTPGQQNSPMPTSTRTPRKADRSKHRSLHADVDFLVHANMQTHARPLMQRQAPRQSVGSWARNSSLTAPRQLAPLRSLPHPQPQRFIHSRARRAVTLAAASHADDFGSRLRRGTVSRCT